MPARASARVPAILLAAAALLSPAASVNMLWGQSAFLTAAVLIGGTRLLPGRPITAGIVLGVLSVKPQHALLVPVMLLALRAWPAMLSAICSAAVLALASVLLFGTTPWLLWQEAARHVSGDQLLWDNSVHTCAILLGAAPTFANALTIAAWMGGAAAVYVAFLTKQPPHTALAVLLAASNLAAPHTGPYDTLLLLVAAGILVIQVRPHPPLLIWILCLTVWMLPYYGQPLISPVARLAPLLTVVLIVGLWRAGTVRKEALLF